MTVPFPHLELLVTTGLAGAGITVAVTDTRELAHVELSDAA